VSHGRAGLARRLAGALAERGSAELAFASGSRPLSPCRWLDQFDEVQFAADQPALFELTFAAGLDKGRFPALAEAGQALFTELAAPARALCGDDHQARKLVLAIAACAHGYAVFLNEGVLADLPEPLADARREAAVAASALIAVYASRHGDDRQERLCARSRGRVAACAR
jgi:hypothetical protein